MINLSHTIHEQIPTYGNSSGPKLTADKQICAGDSCNTIKVEMSNHHGTHLDAPLHFNPHGKSITDYSEDYWFCRKAELIDCPLENYEILDIKKLEACLSADGTRTTEALILKTGWSLRRETSDYWKTPPGFSPELADLLRSRFPRLKFFGFDIISLSSFTNRNLGRAAHKRFLAMEPEILILEDLNLNRFYEDSTLMLSNLLVAPLMLEGADGSPCTVFANIFPHQS